MNEGGYEFWWAEECAGPRYRWETVELSGGEPGKPGYISDLCLVQIREAAGFRQYQPLTEEGLYLKFAELEPTPEGILEFAHRYGPLGAGFLGPLGYELDVIDADGRRVRSDCERIAYLSGRGGVEPLTAWRCEVAQMRLLTDLWGHANAGDEKALAEFVRWEEAKVVFRWPAVKTFWNEFPHYLPLSEGFEMWSPLHYHTWDGKPLARRGDLIRPAQLFVQAHLDNLLRLRGAHARLEWSLHRGRPSLVNRPDSLLSAIHLQFAIAVSDPEGGYRIGRCQRCGKEMKLGRRGGAHRADQRTCSTSCRSLMYRQRKLDALRMHAAGRSVKEIAAEVGSTAAQVKKWVTDKKG